MVVSIYQTETLVVASFEDELIFKHSFIKLMLLSGSWVSGSVPHAGDSSEDRQNPCSHGT